MSTRTSSPVQFQPHAKLPQIARVYLRYPSAQLLLGLLTITVIARIAVGQWSWWDLLIVAIVIAAQPFVEWLIHTFILHFRPKDVGGRTIDFHLAKKHRLHHRDPKRIDAVFIPMRPLLVGIPIGAAITLLLLPPPIALTILLAEAVVGNVYEWTHFYIHSGCKPRNRYVKSIERAHRLHHYRNENYWLGVTNNLGDHALGTFPDRDAVPASPTAKSLGIDTGQ